MLQRALAHDEDAQRRMGDRRLDVHRVAPRGDAIEVIGKAAPVPVEPGVEDDARDILDPLHHLDELTAVFGPGRREADAAVTRDCGRHSIGEGRVERIIPKILPVIMGVDIDEARGDQRAIGIDRLARGVGHPPADRNDFTVGYGDVTRRSRGAGSIDDRPAANDRVEHQLSSSAFHAQRYWGVQEASGGLPMVDLMQSDGGRLISRSKRGVHLRKYEMR